MKFVLDTNVLIDYCINERPEKTTAIQLISELTNNNHTILAPANIVNDFFYIINNLFARQVFKLEANVITQATWGLFDIIKDVVGFVGCDESDIFIAEKLRNKNDDLEDNLIVAAAIRADANYLVTNDKNLLKKQLVPTKTPKQIIELLNKKKKK